MSVEGPELEALTHHLAQCPAEFLAPPRLAKGGKIQVAAVVSDLLCLLQGCLLPGRALRGFDGGDRHAHNRLRLVLVACWLLSHDWFRGRTALAKPALTLLATGLTELAELVPAERCVTEPERREELVRRCLQALGLRPARETEAQAEDRLTTLDSVEQQRLVRETLAAERRAREVREAMRRKAAQAAAAKVSRE